MFDFLAFTTALITAAGAIYAYGKTRDALHPAVIVSPVIGYIYGVWPLILNADGGLEQLFIPQQLEYVAWLYLASILAFYVGMCVPSAHAGRSVDAENRNMVQLFSVFLSSASSRRLYWLAVVLGVIALAAYVSMISNVGGFFRAYSQYKGGGWTSSGYIGEAVLLSFPAVLILALSRQRENIRASDVLLALLISLPHLIQGTLGGRRGPLFLVLLVLLMSWYVARGVRPTLRKIVVGIAVIGFAVIVLQSQRKHLYLGSGGQFEAGRIASVMTSSEHLKMNDYVTGISTVLTAEYFNDYYWGRRYLVTIFVRPIPKQIWPTKYEDVNADWLTRYDPNEKGSEMLEAVGFLPAAGSAPGFVADIFHEFSWGAVVVVYLFGRGLGALWRRHGLLGGLWTVIYAEAMILSVYLPTQSFSAWFHRFIFMSVISALVWRYWVGRPMPVLRTQAASRGQGRPPLSQ